MIIDILLKYGTKVSSPALRGELLLHTAASAYKPEILKRFLEHGTSILIQTYNGDISLHSTAGAAPAIAAENSHRTSTYYCNLEKEAAEKTEDHSKSDYIKYPLDHGANPAFQNRESRNLLELIVVAGHEEIIETLLQRIRISYRRNSDYSDWVA